MQSDVNNFKSTFDLNHVHWNGMHRIHRTAFCIIELTFNKVVDLATA